MMRFGGKKKQLLTLMATIAILSWVAWQTLPPITQWNQRQLANQIAQGIEKKGGHAKASEPLRRLASLGTPALGPLVTLASSPRANLARRARQIVEENFATWRIRARVDDNFDLATRTMTLASALASNADRFDPLGKRWAVSLAIRLVDLAESLAAEDAEKLLGECEQVLATSPPRGPRLRSLPETAQRRLPATENRTNTPDIQLAVPSENSHEIFSQGLKSSVPKAEAQMVDTPEGYDAIFSEPATLPSTLSFKNLQSSQELSTQPNSQEPALALNSRLAPIPIPKMDSLASEVVDVPTPQEMEQRQETLRKDSSRALIAQLTEASHYEAGSIRVVLHQRGFSEKELSLSELFFSPQIEDRNQLVEAVSALPAGNARRWLRWLLEDASADVRLRALTALATTNDPQLFRLAREMAVSDQDVRVSELASRIMQQVR